MICFYYTHVKQQCVCASKIEFLKDFKKYSFFNRWFKGKNHHNVLFVIHSICIYLYVCMFPNDIRPHVHNHVAQHFTINLYVSFSVSDEQYATSRNSNTSAIIHIFPYVTPLSFNKVTFHQKTPKNSPVLN